MRNMLKGATLVWTLQVGMVATSSDLAYTWRTYVFSQFIDGTVQENYGKYITVWTKRGGAWKVIVDGGNPCLLDKSRQMSPQHR